MSQQTAKDRLVDAAGRLFYRQGFHATGIDAVIREAGVARMSLYNHFKSKDELILAVLQQRSDVFRSWLRDEIGARAAAPAGQLMALFDVLSDWIAGHLGGEAFAGCVFVKAVGEFPAAGGAIRDAVRVHKQSLRDDLEQLARAAGAQEPSELAADLALLFEGGMAVGQVSGDYRAAWRARRMAQARLTAAGIQA